MRALVVVAVGWGAGILGESWLGGGMALWGALAVAGSAVACVGAARLPGAPRLLGALLLATAVAGGALGSAFQRARVAAGPLLPGEGQRIMEGVVATAVEPTPYGRRAAIDVDRVIDARGQGLAAAARLLVGWEGTGGGGLYPGDRVRLAASPRPPRGYLNPGAFDRGRLLFGRGIDGVATAAPPGPARVDAAARWTWRGAAARAQARLLAAARAATAAGLEDGGALVEALVLGRRGALRPTTEEAFRRAGVSHVLSVSGLHLAAVALLLFAGVRWLWLRTGRMALRISADRVAAATAIPAAAAYTAITGAETATVRALVAATVVLCGAALGRRPDALTALAAAALVILVDAPWAIFEPSFQLSFAAAAALCTLGVRWGLAPPPEDAGRARRALRFAARLAVASLAASLATAPLTALHFGVVQPAGLLANLVVVPIAELAVLPLGLFGVLLAAVWAPLGWPFVTAAAAIGEGLVRGVAAIARVAPVLEVPPPRPLELAALGAALVAAAVLRPARRAAVAAAVACAVAAGSCAVTTWVVPARRDGVVVTFLDVGQGDAVVIEAPGGETWLIDAGGRLFGAPDAGADADERLRAAAGDPGEQAVWRFLRERRVRRLDLVVISHPHPDHYGGLAAVAAHLPIGEVWIAGDEVDDPAWQRLVDDLRGRGIPVRQPPPGVARERGGARLIVLAPLAPDGARVEADEARDVNDNSLVLRLEHAGRAVLLPGDIEADAEATLVATTAAPLLAADVVKVPHHGSRTSSSTPFIAATHPAHVVFSCGVANRFGFPAPPVLARWRASGAHLWRTDLAGAVTVTISPSGSLRVSSFR